MDDSLIFRTEVMINIDNKNRTGTLDLFENKCIVYNETSLLNQFEFDIIHADIEVGRDKVNFLDLYVKEKEYVQLITPDDKSIRYYLKEYRAEILVGKFEQRKAERRNFQIIMRAFELGYSGPKKHETFGFIPEVSVSKPEKVIIRRPEELKTWEDLLTPLEWRDYYHSLGNTGKKIYDTILDGIVNCRETVSIDGVNLKNDAVGVIYYYILWDNPAIFCIGEYAMWRAVEPDGKHIRITSLCGGKKNEELLRGSVLKAVVRILSFPGIYEYNDIQKEKFIHDYMVKNWPYEESCGNGGANLEPYTVYGTLIRGTAVCEGFAKTTKLLLDILGVHTQVVSGTIKSKKAGHAWNTVKIFNQAYHYDVTFDIGQTGGLKYPIRYDYFNVAAEDLIDREWQLPHVVWRCNSKDYSYPACVGGVIDSPEGLERYLFKELSKKKPYLYIKLTGKLQNLENKTEWIQFQYHKVCIRNRQNAKALIIPSDVKNLYVIAVNYSANHR